MKCKWTLILNKQNNITDTLTSEVVTSLNKHDNSISKKTCHIDDSDAPGLVPYSFSESSDFEKTTVNIPRKRCKKPAVNKMNWSNKSKLNRQHGRNYLSKKKDEQGWNYDVTKKAKNMKPICHCALSKKNLSQMYRVHRRSKD